MRIVGLQLNHQFTASSRSAAPACCNTAESQHCAVAIAAAAAGATAAPRCNKYGSSQQMLLIKRSSSSEHGTNLCQRLVRRVAALTKSITACRSVDF
eukprot:4076-Heterococcus_DN1.PRE.2